MKYVSASDIARQLDVTPKTVLLWVQKGVVKPTLYTPSKKPRWSLAGARALLEKHGYPVPDDWKEEAPPVKAETKAAS